MLKRNLFGKIGLRKRSLARQQSAIRIVDEVFLYAALALRCLSPIS